jgi:4'-phosphopantetheinyl transferase
MRLMEEEIHLWWIDLDDPVTDTSLLSAEELERLKRFRVTRDRARFAAARTAVREILADYVGADPDSLAIGVSHNGKPELKTGPRGNHVPAFSLSHSANHAVLAVTRQGCIGVDLEVDGPTPDRATMLAALSQHERDAARVVDDQALSVAFRIAWTRKEACLKAAGIGFAIDPTELEVGLDRAPRVVHVLSVPALNSGEDALPVHVVTLPPVQVRTVSLARVGVPITAAQVFQFSMSQHRAPPTGRTITSSYDLGAFKCAESLQF